MAWNARQRPRCLHIARRDVQQGLRLTRRHLRCEPLESRRLLAVASFPGNTAPPDLNLSAVAEQVVRAGKPLSVNLLTAGGTVTDSGADKTPNNQLRLYLDANESPIGTALVSDTGLFSWTPTTAQIGSHSVTIIAVDGGTPALADAEVLRVKVLSGNSAPSFNIPADPPAVIKGAAAQTVNNFATDLNAGAPDESAQTLQFLVTDNSKPSLFAVAPSISPGGVLTYTPAAGMVGTAQITVRLKDSGGTDFGGTDTSPPKTFTITVKEPNRAPVIAPINDLSTRAGVLIVVPVSASDPDGDTLTFQLDPDHSPRSAQIVTLTATTAEIRWTPTLAELASPVGFIVLVTDGGTPSLADSEDFTVTLQPNHAPVIAPIADLQATVGVELIIPVSATDTDGNALTFFLDPNDAPASATIVSTGETTAAIHWTPTAADLAGPVTFKVLVTDSGLPSLPDAESFQVNVVSSAAVAFGDQQSIYQSVPSYLLDFPQRVHAVDIDRDGDLDLLSSISWEDGSASQFNIPMWYENKGSQGFEPHEIRSLAFGAASVFAADVDGDGDVDVLYASNYEHQVVWYENDGHQAFSTGHVVSTLAGYVTSVFATDLDTDGDLDVLTTSFDEGIAWYENDGNEGFSKHLISSAVNIAFSVYAADLDDDGDLDVLSASYLDDKIAWYENDGAGGFGPQQIISTSADGAISVIAADLDGDGDVDVISASHLGDKIAWYENDGHANPTFTEHVISSSADGAVSVFAADVDEDGDLDVLCTSMVDHKVTWYQNDGQRHFTEQVINTAAGQSASVVAADLDGDGDLDVVLAADDTGGVAWQENETIHGSAAFPGQMEHTISTSAAGAVSVFAADVDGDGDVDVLSASHYDSTIAWYENDGHRNFTPHVISTSAYGATSVFAADVDGDGDLDVLSASYSDDRIAWYENDGHQVFTKHTITTSASGASSVFAADVDGDGDLDVLSASRDDDTIAWYENDGHQVFTKHTITTSANFAESVFAADVDGDGDLDVLSASYSDDRIAWYENDGSESFTPHTITTAANGAQSVFVTDVDGDGDLDVLSASRGDDKIAWYENDGHENFTPHTISTSAAGAVSVFAADVDDDGDVDVLSASLYDSIIAWYENDGSQVFAKHTITTSASGAWSVVAADIDSDGWLEILFTSVYDSTIAWYEIDIGFSPSDHAIATSDNGISAVLTVDMDDDGDLDVVSARPYGTAQVSWYENDGHQNFTQHEISTSPNTQSVFAADVDSDGDIDVLAASSDGAEAIVWYKNDGQQNFTKQWVGTSGQVGSSIYAADVDGDGDLDFVTTSTRNKDIVSWYENVDGHGGFDQHIIKSVISSSSHGANSVCAADIDGDGDMDVVAGSYRDGTITWFENDGDQHFTERVISTTAEDANSVYVADVDGDGDMDILSASGYSDRKIAWYQNDGQQHFTERVISTAAGGGTSVVAADLDGDGDLDVIATANYYGQDEVTWYENDGQQHFTARVIQPGTNGGSSAVVADIDRDGDLDVLSVDGWEKIAWFENRGGQVAFNTTRTAPPTLGNSQTDDLLSITVSHRGRAGDHDLELATVALRFEDATGNALTTAQANALIDQLSIYRDQNNDGIFTAADDALVATVDVLSLASDGTTLLVLPDADPRLRVAAGESAKFFVVVKTTSDAASQTLHSFRVRHLTDASAGGVVSSAEDYETDIPLSLEATPSRASRTVTVLATATGNASPAASSLSAAVVDRVMQSSSAVETDDLFDVYGEDRQAVPSI